MFRHNKLILLTLAVGVAAVDGTSKAQQTVQSEPIAGSLSPGSRVLVDDGSCRHGRIKLVVGGTNIDSAGRIIPGRPRMCYCTTAANPQEGSAKPIKCRW
jgi:hypothetical protein